jgi:hypothetical protein
VWAIKERVKKKKKNEREIKVRVRPMLAAAAYKNFFSLVFFFVLYRRM